MFCKYCGKAIDEGTMRCRICGRPVGPLEGGNGFWDLAENKSPAPETPAETAAAENEELRVLREQVELLRREQKQKTQPKKSALPALAALLGLLALALCVFLLLQVRNLSGQMQSLELRLTGSPAAGIREDGTDGSDETDGKEQAAESGSKWKGVNSLAELTLQPSPNLFDGPNKGKDDPRGQSINLGQPEYGVETPIFTSRFLGQPGVYRFYWARVEADEITEDTYFTPLLEEDGYVFHDPAAIDADQTYVLSILGEVKKEHLGRYAFVVVDPQTRFAYVSPIVELYDRADQGVYAESESDPAEESGGGNGG